MMCDVPIDFDANNNTVITSKTSFSKLKTVELSVSVFLRKMYNKTRD